MDVSIANRLYEYRRKNNLSQEELAEKIGVSRQAVSKWERAEASPDTDNLILLAKLYGVSLDELLNSDPQAQAKKNQEKITGDRVSISPKGIHVTEEDGNQVHIDWKGVHVKDVDDDTEVHVDWTGVHGHNEDGDFSYSLEDAVNCKKKSFARSFPIVLLAVVVYLILGGLCDLWTTGLLVFFVIPIYYQFVDFFTKKSWHGKLNSLPVVMISVLVFLYLGIVKDLWHPYWILLLIGPVYHSLISVFVPRKHNKEDIEPVIGAFTIKEDNESESTDDA